MKTTSCRHIRPVPAFTLMEIMVVIAIIAVLFTMVVGGLGWYKRKTQIGKTEVLLKSIDRALEDYRMDNATLPAGNGSLGSSEDVYAALYGDENGDGQPDDGATVYLDVLSPDLSGNRKNVKQEGAGYVVIDAWKKELFYQFPGVMNPPNDFDLWSLGPNGSGGPETGTPKDRSDDIKNW